MAAGQRERRARVIEAVRDLVPRRGRMASAAGLAQAPSVRVAVAIAAVLKRDPGQPAFSVGAGRVAPLARQAAVLPDEGEAGAVMREARSRRPSALVVTGPAARGAESSAMDVLVAARAGRRLPEEGPRLAMASRAGQAGMSPLQGMPGLPVIEGGLPLFSPVDEREVAPVMLDVAALAFAVVGPRVQAASGRDAVAQSGVAGQALVAGHSAAGLVTAQAARASLGRGVGAAELARRDLRVDDGRRRQAEDGGQQRASGHHREA
jgi:hypothetical protein